MKWWKQIKMYKNLLLAVLVLNAFLIVTGVTFIVLHFQGQRLAEQSYLEQVRHVQSLEEISVRLGGLEEHQRWTGAQWAELGELQAFAKLKLTEIKLDFSSAFNSERPKFDDLKKDVNQEKELALQKLIESGKSLGSYRREIVIISVLSAFFGLVLPLVLLSILKKKTLKFHRQVEGQVLSTLKIWRAQSAKHQNLGGLSSSLFWLDVGLLTLAQFTKDMDHPGAAYVHELAQKFFQELQNTGASQQDQAEPKNDIEKPGHVS